MHCLALSHGYVLLSDIAPKIGFLGKQNNSVHFRQLGQPPRSHFSYDAHRGEFEIKLSPAIELSVDAVQCLRCYLDRTKDPDIRDKRNGGTPRY